MNYYILREELLTDPLGLGYQPLIDGGSDHLLAQMLNLPTENCIVARGIVPSHEISSAITPEDYSTLSQSAKDWLLMILVSGQVNLDGEVRDTIKTLFSSTTQAYTNLNLLADRYGSRAEQLGLPPINQDDISIALRVIS